MITLLASIVGFISSIIPDVLKLAQDRSNKKHQLDIINQQVSAHNQGITTEFEAYKIKSDQEETNNLYSTYKSGINWVDAINASVRPALAYAFFGLYSLVKYKQYEFLSSSMEARELVEKLWTVDDQAIFAGIISFYFGQRAILKRFNLGKFIK